MIHEDDFMRQMGNEMSAKFQNWSDYSLTLGIAVLMDPRYMMSFVEWAYIKLHGENPLEVVMFKDTLNSLYEVYVHRWSSQMRDAHILKMKIHNFRILTLYSIMPLVQVLEMNCKATWMTKG